MLKTCVNCLVKKKAKGIEQREQNREARKQIKDLKLDKVKLSPIFKNYSSYKDNYRKLFKKTPSFDDYLEALRTEKIKLAHELRKEKTSKKIKEMPDENLGEDLGIEFDRDREDLGSTRQSNKPKAQYEKQPESDFMGSNAWHEANPERNPIRKISIQDRFKAEFFTRAE